MHASINHTELDISVQDVRMAMQDCGAMGPVKSIEDEDFEGQEDMRGVEEFLDWVTGRANREIRRVALEGAEGKDDYLSGMIAILCPLCAPSFNPSQCSKRNIARRTKTRDIQGQSWESLRIFELLKLKVEKSAA